MSIVTALPTRGIRLVHEVTPEVMNNPPLPLTALAEAKHVRWQWTLFYNRVRSAPWTPATPDQIVLCRQVIAIIDALLDEHPHLTAS